MRLILSFCLPCAVPAQMDKETFWKRYFFRVHQVRAPCLAVTSTVRSPHHFVLLSQIELDAERRSALLDTTTAGDAEDDFSWEDDEDDSKPTSPSAATATPKAAIGKSPVVPDSATVPERQSTPTGPAATPAAASTTADAPNSASAASQTAQTSPRDSSEGSSYDIVSNTSGQTKPSVVSSPAPTVQGSAPASTKAADEEDEDSDWE